MSYFVKFKNYSLKEGTAKLHYDVIKEKGKVLWGQWSKNGKTISEKTYKSMNQNTFTLYALDKETALLKMNVLEVLKKEEVISRGLQYLIPNYYSIEEPTACYFLIDQITIEPVEYGNKVFTSGGNSILQAKQVPSYSPWRVTEKEQIIEIEKVFEKELTPIQHDKSYSVYKYTSKINGKSYIGLTNDIERRKKEHESPNSWIKSKKYLYILFSIQGLESFDFEILETNLNYDQAKFVEAMEIERYNSYYPNGLNERIERKNLL